MWSIDKANSEFAGYRRQLLEIKLYFICQKILSVPIAGR